MKGREEEERDAWAVRGVFPTSGRLMTVQPGHCSFSAR